MCAYVFLIIITYYRQKNCLRMKYSDDLQISVLFCNPMQSHCMLGALIWCSDFDNLPSRTILYGGVVEWVISQ